MIETSKSAVFAQWIQARRQYQEAKVLCNAAAASERMGACERLRHYFCRLAAAEAECIFSGVMIEVETLAGKMALREAVKTAAEFRVEVQRLNANAAALSKTVLDANIKLGGACRGEGLRAATLRVVAERNAAQREARGLRDENVSFRQALVCLAEAGALREEPCPHEPQCRDVLAGVLNGKRLPDSPGPHKLVPRGRLIREQLRDWLADVARFTDDSGGLWEEAPGWLLISLREEMRNILEGR